MLENASFFPGIVSPSDEGLVPPIRLCYVAPSDLLSHAPKFLLLRTWAEVNRGLVFSVIASTFLPETVQYHLQLITTRSEMP